MAYIKTITVKKFSTRENGNVFYDVKFGGKVIGIAAYIADSQVIRFKAREGVDLDTFEFVCHYGHRCDIAEIKQRIIEQAINRLLG